MDAIQENQENNTGSGHTAWLRFLLILSFTGGGIGLLQAIASLAGEGVFVFLKEFPLIDTLLIEDRGGSWFYLVIKALLYCASLTGVFFMWKLKRAGFWIYLAAQLLLLAAPFMLAGRLGWTYLLVNLAISGIFTLLFIILYALQLKRMS